MTQISELVIYAVRSILELRVFELSSIMNASQGISLTKNVCFELVYNLSSTFFTDSDTKLSFLNRYI